MHASDYDHFIPLTLSLTVVWIEISKKKTPIFYSLGSCYPRLANRKKLIVPLEKYFKTLNNMINGTPAHNVLSHLQFFNKVGKKWCRNMGI